jgi:hypothetical protein
MERLRLVVATLALGGLAVALGYIAALAFITIWGWIFPFRPRWD